MDLPCCVGVLLPRALVITPAKPRSPGSFGCSLDSGLPLSSGGSAFATYVFGAYSTFTQVRARQLAELPRAARCVEGSRRFVTSPATSTTSGWNDKLPVWVSHPQDRQHLHGARRKRKRRSMRPSLTLIFRTPGFEASSVAAEFAVLAGLCALTSAVQWRARPEWHFC